MRLRHGILVKAPASAPGKLVIISNLINFRPTVHFLACVVWWCNRYHRVFDIAPASLGFRCILQSVALPYVANKLLFNQTESQILKFVHVLCRPPSFAVPSSLQVSYPMGCWQW